MSSYDHVNTDPEKYAKSPRRRYLFVHLPASILMAQHLLCLDIMSESAMHGDKIENVWEFKVIPWYVNGRSNPKGSGQQPEAGPQTPFADDI